jgi:hypothetical protein
MKVSRLRVAAGVSGASGQEDGVRIPGEGLDGVGVGEGECEEPGERSMRGECESARIEAEGLSGARGDHGNGGDEIEIITLNEETSVVEG